jgi:hypothetical protein
MLIKFFHYIQKDDDLSIITDKSLEVNYPKSAKSASSLMFEITHAKTITPPATIHFH